MQEKSFFERVAALANLSFEAFLSRLDEHFGKGFIIDDKYLNPRGKYGFK